MQDRFETLGVKHRLGTRMKILSFAREGLDAGDEVWVIGVVRIEQRAAEPDHPSWRDLPEGPLYITERANASNGGAHLVHESELEPVE